MEIAGGLLVAEEVITHGLEAGIVGGYALAKNTLPLRCTLSQFAKAPEEGDSASLARKHHSFSVINNDIYIFGGLVSQDKLAGNEVHIIKLSNKEDGSVPQYKCVPAIARDGESENVPGPRAGHTAVVVGEDIVVFGGYSDPSSKQPISEKGRIWIFSTTTLQWTHRDSEHAAPSRAEHASVAHEKELVVIHGGRSSSPEKPLSDTWAYNLSSNTWVELSALSRPEPTANLPPSLAIANSTLYLISNSSTSTLHNTIYTLDLKATSTSEVPPQWAALSFPTNPLTPGPTPRSGAGLATLYTGQGRVYILYILGSKTSTSPNSEHPQSSSIWSLQLPSSNTTGAGIKDTIREKVGAETHEAEWAEVEIVPTEQKSEIEGKAHPGPRAWFGWDVVPGGIFRGSSGKVLLWGGEDPSGKIHGDGWVIDVRTPSATGILKKIPGVKNFVKGDEE